MPQKFVPGLALSPQGPSQGVPIVRGKNATDDDVAYVRYVQDLLKSLGELPNDAQSMKQIEVFNSPISTFGGGLYGQTSMDYPKPSNVKINALNGYKKPFLEPMQDTRLKQLAETLAHEGAHASSGKDHLLGIWNGILGDDVYRTGRNAVKKIPEQLLKDPVMMSFMPSHEVKK